jgi:fluoroquinolone resistance protein
MDIQLVRSEDEWTDAAFENESQSEIGVSKVNFERCAFTGLSGPKFSAIETTFVGCTFTNCDLSMATWIGSSLRDCHFFDSKLTGSDFSRAVWNAYSATSPIVFERCDLSYVNFSGAKFGKATFTSCRISEAHFARTELVEAVFSDCDLAGADFLGGDLRRADFRGAHSFTIDPTASLVKGAKFSHANLQGLVSSFGIEIE